METRANYALIGLFTLLVILGAFLFAFWFSDTGKRTARKDFEVRFTGSVSGLATGGSVLFNGLKVGEVKELGLMREDPSRVYAIIEVDALTPVKTDTKAKLEAGTLTGVAWVALLGGSAGADPMPARGVINATPSEFQDLLQTVQRMSVKADAFLERTNKLIDDNSANISATVANVEALTASLSDKNSNFQQALSSFDPQKVRSILDNADQSMAKVNAILGNGEAKKVVEEFGETAKSFKKLAESLTRFSNTGLKQYEGLAVDGRHTLENVDRAVRQLEKNPQSVLFGAKPALPAYEGK